MDHCIILTEPPSTRPFTEASMARRAAHWKIWLSSSWDHTCTAWLSLTLWDTFFWLSKKMLRCESMSCVGNRCATQKKRNMAVVRFSTQFLTVKNYKCATASTSIFSNLGSCGYCLLHRMLRCEERGKLRRKSLWLQEMIVKWVVQSIFDGWLVVRWCHIP